MTVYKITPASANSTIEQLKAADPSAQVVRLISGGNHYIRTLAEPNAAGLAVLSSLEEVALPASFAPTVSPWLAFWVAYEDSDVDDALYETTFTKAKDRLILRFSELVSGRAEFLGNSDPLIKYWNKVIAGDAGHAPVALSAANIAELSGFATAANLPLSWNADGTIKVISE